MALFGRCGASDCTLVVQRLLDGSVRLAYHGTAEHSMVLDFDQQAALADVLSVLNRDWNIENQDHE